MLWIVIFFYIGGSNGLMVESRVNVKRIKKIIVAKISTGNSYLFFTQDLFHGVTFFYTPARGGSKVKKYNDSLKEMII